MRLNSPRRLYACLFSIVLSISFISYSIESYVPPSIHHSVSYSILNCPSHSIQNSLSHIILDLLKSESKEGTQKQCFCFPRSNHRSSLIIFKPSFNLLIDKYVITLISLSENPHLKDFYTKFFIRSPPLLIA